MTEYPQKLKIRVLNYLLPDGNILQAGIKMNEEEEFLAKITFLFFNLLIIALILGIASSWFISFKAMSGLKRVVVTANNIGKKDLNQRVAPGNEGEEIRELVDAFNQMLSRIQTLIVEVREISDNIAHDLRTPLTRIRGIIETTINKNAETSEYRDMCGEILEECERLVSIINTMLEITRTDSKLVELNREDLNMNTLLQQAYDLFYPVAEAKNIALTICVPAEELMYYGDKSRLQRMVANILDNAIKYTPEKGQVRLSLVQDRDWAYITVEDTGCGISEKDQKLVFDRFYRCDNSRFLPGNGLGLSLALAIAKIHNGEINLESSLGKGTSLQVKLPLNKNK
jgi:signal transduction histidine kinase